ncbi:Williams-Beuren syndrome chromosome region 27 [Caenispirillum salinarum AK4]|uniref:Williams-Beuren syndrome chromosome region 27 n=1 Tax=Caenispirillum salinarum AK4 TaxID=1238182 RepID=K9GUW3_9PROT|nr:methyltransferase domain-containing protein [Caenispirillum salinarum]EKV29765.1 Williams-Beuren syndrome chromosome region 27 [Caenispirillum salinarum AK4]
MSSADDTAVSPSLTSLKDGSTDSGAVETYYDDWAGTYDDTLASWDYQAPRDAVDQLVPHLAEGARVLDVGCGTGLVADAVLGRGRYRLDGMDISAASLALAEKRGGYGHLVRHDLQIVPLPIADDAYDAAACVGVLTYIEAPEALLSDMCRVVRPGGTLCFTQRTDRWEEKGFDALLERMEQQGLWTVLTVSEPKPYLPSNSDYGESIKVIHVTCRVR